MKHRLAARRLQMCGQESLAVLFASNLPITHVTHGPSAWFATRGLRESGRHRGQHDRSLPRHLSSSRSRQGGHR